MLTVQHYGPPLSVARRIQTQKTKQPKGCSAASVITKREIIMETKESAKKDYDSSGNNQVDYEWLRDVVEELVPETSE